MVIKKLLLRFLLFYFYQNYVDKKHKSLQSYFSLNHKYFNIISRNKLLKKLMQFNTTIKSTMF